MLREGVPDMFAHGLETQHKHKSNIGIVVSGATRSHLMLTRSAFVEDRWSAPSPRCRQEVDHHLGTVIDQRSPSTCPLTLGLVGTMRRQPRVPAPNRRKHRRFWVHETSLLSSK
jgi:hypothetical protein